MYLSYEIRDVAFLSLNYHIKKLLLAIMRFCKTGDNMLHLIYIILMILKPRYHVNQGEIFGDKIFIVSVVLDYVHYNSK